MLGILQLTLAYHAKLVAEYAVYKVARAASVYRVDCQRMIDAAVVAVGPTLPAAGGATVQERLANAIDQALGQGNDVPGVHSPRVLVQYYLENFNPSRSFDDQLDPQTPPMVVRTRLIYFFEARVPFANWILVSSWMAASGMVTWSQVQWVDPTNPGGAPAHQDPTMQTNFDQELQYWEKWNFHRNFYTLPLVTTWSMRMMSDPRNLPAKHPYNTCICQDDNCTNQ